MRITRLTKIVFFDTLKEIFREKVSYIIFILLLIGLSHTILVSLNAKILNSSAIGGIGKELFIEGVFSVFSFLYLGIIFLSLFLNNSLKENLGKKCELLFYGIKANNVMLMRSIGFLAIIIFLSFFWYVTLYLVNLFKFHIPFSIFWKSYTLILFSFALIIPIPLFLSFKLSGMSTFFVSFIFLFTGDLVTFSTPYTGLSLGSIKHFINFLPNWNFITLSYIERITKHYGLSVDMGLSTEQIIITIVITLIFCLLILLSKNAEI